MSSNYCNRNKSCNKNHCCDRYHEYDESCREHTEKPRCDKPKPPCHEKPKPKPPCHEKPKPPCHDKPKPPCPKPKPPCHDKPKPCRKCDCKCKPRDCKCYIIGDTPYDFSGATAHFPAAGQFLNPLVAMDAAEINATAAIVKLSPEYLDLLARNPRGVIFSFITLQEPPKAYVNSWYPSDGTKRVAQTLVYGPDTNQSIQFLSDLNLNYIFRADYVCVMPPLDTSYSPEASMTDLLGLLKSDQRINKALQKRGFTSADIGTKVLWFSQPFASLVDEKENNECCQEIIDICNGDKRIFYLSFTVNLGDPTPEHPDVIENQFFSFIDGLLVFVNATDQTIFKVVDEYVVPNPTLVADPIANMMMARKLPLTNGINITQPGGPNYSLNVNEVLWDNWKLKYSYHPRTGPQIYQVQYWDSLHTDQFGNIVPEYRDILYKLNVNEAGVYYNPAMPLFARGFVSNDSDAYALLNRIQPQQPGLDSPAYSTFVDLYYVDKDGVSVTIPRGLAIFEQIGEQQSYRGLNLVGDCDPSCVPVGSTCIGDQFKCQQSGSVDQELVFRFFFSGVLYLWTFSFVFSPTGYIRTDIDVSARAFYQTTHISAESQPWSAYFTKNKLGFNHTHYWLIRADFQIDGQCNTVVENNQYRIETPCGEEKPCKKNKNICGQVVKNVETELKTELTAVRNQNVDTNRSWEVINPNKTNRLGENVGYELIPLMVLNRSLAATKSWPYKHYSFLNNTLHVTKYCDTEQFGAGNFPISACKDVGLGRYIKNDANIVNEDVVLWYNLIYGHSCHTEDQPFVTTKSGSLVFAPHNFFNINPGYGLVNLIGNTCA